MKNKILKLYSGEGYEELSMERIVKLLPRPRIIRLPGAPEGVAGLIDYEGSLVAARYLEGAVPKETYECAVLTAGEDGSLWGILADELAGGEQVDTVYGQGI